MIESSNMTHEEFYRVNGTLTPARIDDMLGKLGKLDESSAFNVSGFVAYAQEASAQYPAEDFLNDQVTALQEFSKRLRGDNRKDLLHIVECISDALQCQFYATDYGTAELRKIINAGKQ